MYVVIPRSARNMLMYIIWKEITHKRNDYEKCLFCNYLDFNFLEIPEIVTGRQYWTALAVLDGIIGRQYWSP